MAITLMRDVLTIMLVGLSGLLLLAAASAWLKLVKDREGPNERPVIPVRAFRRAAAITVAAFVLLGVALCWQAMLAVLAK